MGAIPPSLDQWQGAVEPIFLRKLDRPSVWTKAQDGEPEAAIFALFEESGDTSLWRIQEKHDLRRVAIAINGGRESLTEKLSFLPILQSELDKLEIQLSSEDGDTPCLAARKLHLNAATQKQHATTLVEMLLGENRGLIKCSPGQMKRAKEQAMNEGCQVVLAREVAECVCTSKA